MADNSRNGHDTLAISQRNNQARTGGSSSAAKARYWMGTIPCHQFVPFVPPGVAYIKGQLESGQQGGYLHWQLLIHTSGQQRLSWLRKTFGEFHFEPTRSDSAEDYVWKEETSVPGTRFELGKKSIKRNASTDWDNVWDMAKRGRYEDIPKDIAVRCYSQLKSIAKDNMQPVAMERTVRVFCGPTHTGKSHRAWEEATLQAYPKDPMSKFWDGYQGHKNVVIEEFRGDISISHMLRWTDKYPVIVDAKHGATILQATNIWITSNVHPRDWYPNLDEATRNALLRRLQITEMEQIYEFPGGL